MAVSITISETMTEMWDADTLGTWSSGSPSLLSGFQREGTNCIGMVVSNTTVNTYTTVTSFNGLQRRIYIWMSPRGTMDTLANGGIRMVVGDGTNIIAYYVGGSDYSTPFTTGGGWYCYVLDLNNKPTNYATIAGSEASLDETAITQVGVGFKTLSKSLGGAENCFWDIGRHGTGLNIKGGTSGDPGTWAEIAADDASTSAGKAYGIVMEFQAGVYGVQGSITFGDSTGTTSTYFKDANSTVVLMDTGLVSIGISAVGNSTGTNTFIDGVAVGSGDTKNGRAGSTYVNAGVQATVTFTDTNVDTLQLYGTKFQGIDQGISFSTDITHDLAGVAFQACGQINLASVIARNCIFSETTATDAALLWNGSINIKNSRFIANTTGAGVEHPSATGSPFVYDNLLFSGNTYDVNNTSGSSIEISKTNSSDPSTYTGSTVTFIGASVTTAVTVKDLSTGGNIENARVLVWPTDSTNFPYKSSVSITGSGTTATVTHNSHGLTTGDFVIIEGVENDDDYNGVHEITVTGTNTYTYTADDTLTSPATGTSITATFAFISGLTNASGYISDTRVVNANQPIAGWVRKASASPYYQQGPITGTVSSTLGFSGTIQLVRDE